MGGTGYLHSQLTFWGLARRSLNSAIASVLGRARKIWNLAMALITTLRGAFASRRRPAGAEDAYAAAHRHSRRVRALRRAIPVACALGLVLPVLWGIVAPYARTVPDVQVGAVSITGTKIRMDAPKLSGFKKDQKAYEVTAREALQDIKVPTVVELNGLNGRMEQETNSFARVTAEWGRFDQSADRLDLKGDIRVRTDKGYEADLSSARIDMKTGDVATQERVEIRSKSGTIEADSMTIRENGKHALFEGRVRSVFVHDEAAAKPHPRPTLPQGDARPAPPESPKT
jgi:lipopolysaccharide export system protein LptC